MQSMQRPPAPVAEVISRLREAYPDAMTGLCWSSPLELLVATILSARCTDAKVNQVTGILFERYRTAEDYAEADPAELEEILRPTGFYRNKARSVRGMAQALLRDYGGEVPETMPELTELPGVGRKTANVVLGNAFGINDGVVVDTHVHRLSNRLGLSSESNPDRVEQDLLPQVPEADRTAFSNLLISHGRSVCKPRKPDCPECVLSDICPSSTV